ncbi:MAG: VanZ family protein [Eubacteriales bacterium]|nr:VanZ family protein [Eubacteriales bacterium]
MKELLMWGYEALTVLLPCALVYIVMHKRGAPVRWRRVLLLFVFAVFIAGVFYVTGTGTVYELRYMLRMDIPCKGFNLAPFSEEINPVGYALNMIMLVPFGFLAPFIWPKLDRLGRIALASFSFSLLIELSQLVNYRSSDVDDLILNTIGGVLGFAFYRLYARLTHREATQNADAGNEPALYIGAMFLGWFLMFNGLGAAGLLYGF